MADRFFFLTLPGDRSREARGAWQIMLIGFPLTLIAAFYYLYLALRLGHWQIYAWSADIFALAFAVLAGGVLVRREREVPAVWLIIGAIVVTFNGVVALIQDVGFVIGLSQTLLVILVAGQALPHNKSAGWASLVGVSGGVASLLLDYWLPPYRLPQPEMTRIFLPSILVVAIGLYGYMIVRQFRNFSLRAKLLISILFTTLLSVAAIGYFAYTRFEQSQTFLSGQLQSVVQKQAHELLNEVAVTQANQADQALFDTSKDVQVMANYRATLYSNDLFTTGTYWDGKTSLITLPGGQHGNPTSDTASVFIPNTISITDALIADLNASAYLGVVVPGMIQANPTIIAMYFIDENGASIYYPNVGLAESVPPDFDPRTQLFYTIATPENNPEGKVKWTAPYQDPAGTGLIVTSAAPVYDNRGVFRGVLAADVQLVRISNQIDQIRVGKTGFAFLIDSEGHLLAMHEASTNAFRIFGLNYEPVPINETPKQTVLNRGPSNLQVITRKMTAGEKGLGTISIDGAPYYVAYAPLSAIGYSMGIIAPASDFDAPYLAARESIEDDTRSTLRLASFIFSIVLAAAIGMGILISQIIARPLVALTQTANEILDGNLDAQARVEAQDESGVLAQTFNAMTAQLRASIGNLEQRVIERTKALTTSAEVSRHLTSILDPRHLAGAVVNEVRDAYNYYYAQIYLFDDARENLVLAAGTGKPGEEMLKRGHSLPKGRGLVGQAAETKKPILVPDTSQNPNWLPNQFLPDTKAEAVVPILSGDRVLGVLDIQDDVANDIFFEDITLLESLASQVAISLQNAELYEQAESALQEARSLIAFSTEGIAILDLETELWAEPNESFARTFGMTREEMAQTGPKIMSPPKQPDGRDSTEKAVEMINTAMNKGSHRFEWVHLTKDGKPFDCEIGLVRMPGEHPRLRQSLVDITERKRLQEMAALRARQQEALNAITQKIQAATTIEDAMQVAARELGRALGKKQTLVALEPSALGGHDGKTVAE